MATQGHVVQAVIPTPLHRLLLEKVRGLYKRYPYQDQVKVYRPGYFALTPRFLPELLGYRAAYRTFQMSVKKSLHAVAKDSAFVYAHFFYSGNACIVPCRELGLPLVVALGESDLGLVERIFGQETLLSSLQAFDAIIAVSKENQKFILKRDPALEGKIIHLPNGVDVERFHPRPQSEARARLGLPMGGPLVIFVGHFNERKGALRVLEAVNLLPNVQVAFLGRGTDTPSGPNVCFTGPVSQGQIAWWLSAADLFVLPSLAEGMSNAILEALACGLPVVVSDLEFNHEFLDEASAVFVDPLRPVKIAEGIRYVLENPERKAAMGKAARKVAERYPLEKRVEKIVHRGLWLSSRS